MLTKIQFKVYRKIETIDFMKKTLLLYHKRKVNSLILIPNSKLKTPLQKNIEYLSQS